MRMPGRVSAAIEVLTEVVERHRPASEALRDWGKAHRFAGGGDRHAIGTLVYDALRNRSTAAFRMGGDTPRALVLGTLVEQWKLDAGTIRVLTKEEHGPAALSAQEDKVLISIGKPEGAIAANWPAWLYPAFAETLAHPVAEGSALALRAPIDLRVNTLKATRAQLLEALQRFGAAEGPLAATSVRVAAPGPEQRNINLEAEPAHGMGWFEVQDSASQIAALMAGVKPGEIVADICAGAGGKTLALAAAMQNQGRIIAHDRDRHRLRPIFERMGRSGATNIDVLAAEDVNGLATRGPFDCVVIDAPCSGSGSWRRKPDAKWRFTQKQLDIRLKEQRDVLTRGASLVKPGGRLVYITCSLLAVENAAQVQWFQGQHNDFKIVPYAEQWRTVMGTEPVASADGRSDGLLLSPRQHGTDGFYVCVMKRG